MNRPTISPRDNVSDQSLADGGISTAKLASAAVVGPKLGTNAVGLTQAATVLQRNITVVSLGITPAAGEETVVFRAPASGATINGVYICPGSDQNHAVNEADTWAWTVYNKTTGNALNAVGASLSNTTLAATAFKSIPIDGGNATVLSGQMLTVSSGISNAPAALHYPVAVIEWTPYSNA